MFSFLKKKAENTGQVTCLKAYTSGRVIPVREVPDPVFSEGLLGDGIAIWPEEDEILAPADGVVTVAPEDSRHACGLRLSNGIELLLHVGLDTVSMNGKGFELKVSPGQKVRMGQPLLHFDRQKIKAAGLCDVAVMVVAENEKGISIQFHTGMDASSKKTVIAEF